MAIGTCISINTLNVNGLNAPTKRQTAEWIQKQDPYICCLQETHFRSRDKYRLKVRRWEEVFHANGNQKKVGTAILISDKRDFKIKTVGTSLVLQWLRLRTHNAEGLGSIPGQGTRSHMHAAMKSLCVTTKKPPIHN